MQAIESLEKPIHALKDSANFHKGAADCIGDRLDQQKLLFNADERQDICEMRRGLVTSAGNVVDESGAFFGSLRTFRNSLRAGWNAGDATVVLIGAEWAEDDIAKKFQDIWPENAGSLFIDQLLKNFETVKSGRNRVPALRNAYQNA